MTATSAKLRFTHDFIFHTIQGEGRYIGTPSTFIRLSGCNLRCTWRNTDNTITCCDTPYSSFEPENYQQTIADAISQIQQINCHYVVITGGEPFLQPHAITLINQLVKQGYHVTVETNGTILSVDRAQFLSISPKLASSCTPTAPHYRQHQQQRLNPAILAKLVTRPHQLKFVVNSPGDIEEIEAIIAELKQRNGHYDEDSIYLMPQGDTAPQLHAKLPWLIDIAKTKNWHVTDRLHIRLWGTRRGV